MLAEVLCAGGGSRSLINTGLGAKTAFPNGIRGGVYQNAGVLTSLFILFLLPLFPCFFFFISSRLDGLLGTERCRAGFEAKYETWARQ